MSYALITGASKGIGKCIAKELASRKQPVLLVARSENLLQELASNLSAKFGVSADYLAIDLSMPDAPAQVYGWCERKGYSVHILVNNAGYGLSGPMDRHSWAENSNMMQVNMFTLVGLCQTFLPMLRRQSRSYILNIASSAAYQAVPNLSIYSATKAFVLRFSRGLHQELAKSNVSVTCISPGATDTEFTVRAQIGEKGLKAAQKLNMSPEIVAKMAVDAMYACKTELITGWVNKTGAFLAWLLPNKLVEKTSMSLYE